jgi:hypothetical protein
MIINSYRFAGGGGGGITDPDDVTGCVGWYDASDSATLLDAVTSGSPVADGAVVEVFEDKSALGTIRDFRQTDTAYKPIRRVAQINGLDVLDFDGTNDYMSLNSGGGNYFYQYATQAQAKTVFVVSQPVTAATVADATAINLYKSTTAGAGGLITGEIAYRTNVRTFVSDGTASTTCSTSAPSIITLSQSGSGNVEDVISMWLDGSSVARDSGNDGALVDVNVVTELGAATLSSLYFDGYICEVIFYDNELSAGDRGDVETYLANKWGVTI